jgi:hypothetical protein
LPTDEGRAIVWVWPSSTTAVDTKSAYLFIQEATGRRWSETIHVHWIDRASSILNDLRGEVKDALKIIYGHGDRLKSVQAAGFPAKKNNRNRWPASFNIEEPGKFHLSVIRFGRDAKVVPGGEEMTLLVE